MFIKDTVAELSIHFIRFRLTVKVKNYEDFEEIRIISKQNQMIHFRNLTKMVTIVKNVCVTSSGNNKDIIDFKKS